jgi:hypothetical protein
MHELLVTVCQAGSQVMQGSWHTAEPAWSMSAGRQAEESVHRSELAEAQMEAERMTVGSAEARETTLMCLYAARLEVR